MLARLEKFNYWQRSALLVLVSLLLAAICDYSDVFRRLDYTLSDAHARLLAPEISFADVAIIDVDEESLAVLQPKLGAWPYDREIFGLVTDYLRRSGARAIGFDILFSEGRKGDAEFAATLDKRVVLAAAILPNSPGRDAAYMSLLSEKSWGAAASLPGFVRHDVTLPRASLLARAGVGVISGQPDSDGVVRRIPLMHRVNGHALPGLSLALLHADGPAPALTWDGAQLSAGARTWPVNASGEVTLRFPSNISALPRYSFSQVALAAAGVAGLGHIGAELRGKRVVVGSTSTVLGDFIQTPLGRVPGLHVSALAPELLAGNHVLKPRAWIWDSLLALITLLFAAALAQPMLQKRTMLQLLAIPLLVLFIACAATVFVMLGREVGVLFALTGGLFLYLLATLWRQIYLYRSTQRLQLEKRAAEEADRLKTKFLSHITHELRTPLTAIMGFNNINLMGDEIGRDQRVRNSEIVDRNCRTLLSLVNNLLDQAKLQAGKMSVSPQPACIREVMDEAVETARPLLGTKPVKLVTRFGSTPDVLELDAVRLRQIVLNLVSNAIKFTEHGDITISLHWDMNVLTLEVADTGPGMSEEAVGRLFRAFEQADDSIAGRYGGTGLGLNISRDLAQLMGGDIAVRSELGAGTCFTVKIKAPLAELAENPQSVVTQPPQPYQSNAGLRAGTVLVAEDTPDVRALTAYYLKKLGVTTLTAADGQEAIAQALAHAPDVILMDMEMPRVDGVEATRQLRASGFSAPILALTANKADVDKQRALAAGCNAVLEKPVTHASLQVALEQALAPSRSGS